MLEVSLQVYAGCMIWTTGSAFGMVEAYFKVCYHMSYSGYLCWEKNTVVVAWVPLDTRALWPLGVVQVQL